LKRRRSGEERSPLKKKKRAKKAERPPPEVTLSAKTMKTLETLMLEGDLLEVTMDETSHIWCQSYKTFYLAYSSLINLILNM
jgi:hypothetical protein